MVTAGEFTGGRGDFVTEVPLKTVPLPLEEAFGFVSPPRSVVFWLVTLSTTIECTVDVLVDVLVDVIFATGRGLSRLVESPLLAVVVVAFSGVALTIGTLAAAERVSFSSTGAGATSGMSGVRMRFLTEE